MQSPESGSTKLNRREFLAAGAAVLAAAGAAGAQKTIGDGFAPLPGTKLYDMAKDNLVTDDWSKFRFSANSPVVSYDGMSDKDLSNLMDYAFRSFYLRKEWVANRLKKMSNPEQAEKILDSLFYYINKALGDAGVRAFVGD